MQHLVEIVKKLRDPNDGCPWDLEQTPSSLCKYILEEAYEVVDAIREGKSEHICDELGDLLLQVILQAQIASEAGEFSIEDVIKSISEKMIRRHPHVFGNTEASSSEEVLFNWERIKSTEKHSKEISKSLSTNIPIALQAQKIGKRVAKHNFDWSSLASVWKKVEEEFLELKEEVEKVISLKKDNQKRVEEELGDLLFTLCQLARWTDLDADLALRKSCAIFLKRFAYIEKKTNSFEKKLKKKELEGLWKEAKEALA